MKITITSDPKIIETEINIKCGGITPETEKIISMLRMLNMQLTGKKDRELFILDIADILYIDTADKKTFLYTADQVYESSLKLYELEEQLKTADFFRANKSCIIHFKHVVSVKSELDRRIRVTMSNKEQLIVSRQYAEEVRKRLGVR